MPTETPQEKAAFWKAITDELPAFVAFLQEWKIPKDLVCRRFGVTAFQHPVLMEVLTELSPETRLLRLIDEVIFSQGSLSFEPNSGGYDGRTKPWEGTAERLQHQLQESGFGRVSGDLLKWHNATGTYLSRLASQVPERVVQNRTNSARLWVIYPPDPLGEAQNVTP